MKNRKGSTLALTLVIFLVLMIFATFIFSFVISENKQAIWHENDTRAYYLARSGALAVESGIIRMSKDDDGVKFEKILSNLNSESKDIEFNKQDNTDLLKDNEFLNVTLKKTIESGNENNGTIEIESRGIVNEVENKVVRILEFSLDEGGETGEDLVFPDVIYSKGKIIGMIESGNKQNVFGDYVEDGLIEYLPVEFPEMPTPLFPNKPNTKFKNRIIEIDARGSEQNILIGELELEEGKYKIKIIGDNKVNIYFEEELKMEEKSTLTWESESQEVNLFLDKLEIEKNSVFLFGDTFRNIYLKEGDLEITDNNTTISGNIYLKEGDLEIIGNNITINGDIYLKDGNLEIIGNNTTINGNIYLEDGDLEIKKNNTTINGNIYSSAEEIKIEDKGTINGLIYAPKSDIIIDGDGQGTKVNGGIVGKTVEIDGKVEINYDRNYAKLPSSSSSTDPPEPPSGNSYKFESYFK